MKEFLKTHHFGHYSNKIDTKALNCNSLEF